MNKIAIPASLVAIVMVAGMFAFAPVEQASTVHSTVGADIITHSETLTLTAANDNDLINLTCNQPFSVLSVAFPDAADTANNTFGVDAININSAGSVATTSNVMLAGALGDGSIGSEEILSTLITDVLLTATANANISLTIIDTGGDGNDDEIDITVMFKTASGATCDVAIVAAA